MRTLPGVVVTDRRPLHTTGPVVFVDADNTLWDTDRVFAAAQLALLEGVEKVIQNAASVSDRLAFVRTYDQALAERHYAGLRYPPRLLAKALALGITNIAPELAARLAWSGGREGSRLCEEDAERLEHEFLAALRVTPPLRPGVRGGLAALKRAGCLILILTEGGRDRVMRTAAAHSLSGQLDRVIEARKDRRLFDRLLCLTGHPKGAFMIGDQLDGDIRPAIEAGLRTIHFPGGFRPRWESAESDVQPNYRIERFDEVPAIVIREFEQEITSAQL